MTSQLATRQISAQPMFLGEIFIECRSIYGVTKAYPLCERGQTFAQIAGTKTLTASTLRMIEKMGFEIVSSANADWHKAA